MLVRLTLLLLFASPALGQRTRVPTGPPVPLDHLRAEFDASATRGVLPFRVQFQDLSQGVGVSEWLWDFGDGTTSTEQNPTHVYRDLGTYRVRLEVRGANGTDLTDKRDYIEVGTLAPGFVDEEFLEIPWQTVGFQVLDADGDDLVLWRKRGLVERVIDGVRLWPPMVDIEEEVGNWNDHGLHGFQFDPDYANNGYVYLYYVVDRHHLDYFGTPSYDPEANDFFRETVGRITRYTVFDPADPATTVDPASRLVLLGQDLFTGVPICAVSHGLGTLAFGEDGSLLFSCGDSYLGSSFQTECATAGILRPKDDVQAHRSQLIDSPNGKIHRVDPATGAGEPTNPFFDPLDPFAWRSRVYALGMRQPFRFTVRPEHMHPRVQHADPGEIYFGDVGAQLWEELNVLTEPGQNFGWPIFEGYGAGFYAQIDRVNQDAPNPLFGQPGCTEPFFTFEDLLVEDSLNAASWPNPCDPLVQVPPTIPTFMHRRPAIAWAHADQGFDPPTTIGGFDAQGEATVVPLDDPSVGFSDEPYPGNASIGGTWYTGTTFPEPYRDVYFAADYGENWIRAFRFDHDHELVDVLPFSIETEDVVQLGTDTEGNALYYVQYRSPSLIRRIRYAENERPTAVAQATPAYGPAPVLAQLSASASFDPEEAPLELAWDFGDGEAWTPLHALSETAWVYPSEDVEADAATMHGVGRRGVALLDAPDPLLLPPTPGTDLAVIHDGVYAERGANDESAQAFLRDRVPWVGYVLPAERAVTALVFQEGLNVGAAGAVLDQPRIETWDATLEEWLPVTNLTSTPAYPGDPTLGFETFLFSFDAVPTTAVRLREGKRVGGSRRLTVGELRPLALPNPVPTGVELRMATLTVTDPFDEVDTATATVSLNNTPPTVDITSPMKGATYPVGMTTVLPLTADLKDLEHTLGELSCEWTIELVHDNHAHPEPLQTVCPGTLTILPHEELQGDIVYWTVELKVTDAGGLSVSDSRQLIPEGDCNLNGILDATDISDGTSLDTNANGIPDECEGL